MIICKDTYLQLSFVLIFTKNNYLQLIKLTNDETIDGINKILLIEINNYAKLCRFY